MSISLFYERYDRFVEYAYKIKRELVKMTKILL